MTARITDNLSENAETGYNSSQTQIRFISPSGRQFVDAMLSRYQLTSDTTLNGTYTMTLAQYTEQEN